MVFAGSIPASCTNFMREWRNGKRTGREIRLSCSLIIIVSSQIGGYNRDDYRMIGIYKSGKISYIVKCKLAGSSPASRISFNQDFEITMQTVSK